MALITGITTPDILYEKIFNQQSDLLVGKKSLVLEQDYLDIDGSIEPNIAAYGNVESSVFEDVSEDTLNLGEYYMSLEERQKSRYGQELYDPLDEI